ncbi:MAG: hypothetical protein HRT61_04155 [Ekhidna sp.]|nr:hypothetical protein [Ekhidna sp.]
MKTFTHSFLLSFVFLLIASSLSAQSVVSVNQYTGAAQASIPLWTVTSGEYQVPINLNYSTSGFPVDQPAGQAGIGWYLSAGGQVSRRVNDLPDDLNDLNSTNPSLYGWLHGGAAKVNAFVTNYGATPTGDGSAYPALAEFGGGNDQDDIYDMEPDLFTISVPGHLSASFTIGEAGQPILLGNQQLDITYSSGSQGAITAFEVTTLNETVYVFEKHTEITATVINESTEPIMMNNKRIYYSHQDGQTYTTSWTLRKITSHTGDVINFFYGFGHNIYFDDGTSEESSSTEVKDFNLYYLYEPIDDFRNGDQFDLELKYNHVGHLSAIDTKWERVTIGKNGIMLPLGDYEIKYPILTDIRVLDKRTDETHHFYEFRYNPVQSNEETFAYRSHLYLSTLFLHQGSTTSRYMFDYYGVSAGSSTFTDRETEETDQYGYYSPRIQPIVTQPERLGIRAHYYFPEEEGMERVGLRPAPSYTKSQGSTTGFNTENPIVSRLAVGSLKEVTLPLSGTERISYEVNRYYDSLSGQDEYGGGIRVKKVRIHDGVDHANDVLIDYDYQLANGFSSGVLMYKPTFHYLNPYQLRGFQAPTPFYFPELEQSLPLNQALGAQLLFSKWDLTESDHPGYSVAYQRCVVSRSGFGSTTTLFDINKNATDINKQLIGGLRYAPNAAGTLVPQTGLSPTDYLPFNHSLLYRFNGKPLEMTQRDADGDLVSRTAYEYQRYGISTPVYGLRSMLTSFETVANGVADGFGYGHYQIDHGLFESRAKVTTWSYDPSDDANFSQTETIVNHDDLGRVTSNQSTDKEGRVYRTYFKYPDAYTISPTGPRTAEVEAWSKLVAKGQIYQPIETYQTLEIGGVEHTIDATFGEWEYYIDRDIVYPKSSYVLDIGDPIPDFLISSIDESSDAVFDIDDRYQKLGTVLSRNQFGKVVSAIDRTKNKSALTYNHEGKYASGAFTGAIDSEVIFDDFESKNVDIFDYPTIPGVEAYAEGRVIGLGKVISIGKEYYTFTPENDEYLFSCWIKSMNSADLNVRVIHDGVEIASVSIPVSNDNSWHYYSTEMAALVSPGLQYLELSGTGDFTIDEVAFHPKDVGFSYTHIGTNGRKLAETSKGISQYFEYHSDGSLKLVRDEDFNMLQAFDYHKSTDLFRLDNASISAKSTNVNSTTSLTVFDAKDCNSFEWVIIDRATYEGNPSQLTDFTNPTGVSNSNELNYTFTAEGLYFVAVRMTCGGLPVIKQKRVQIERSSLGLDLCFDRKTTIDINAADTDSYTGPCPINLNRVAGAVQFELLVTADPGVEYTIDWYSGTSSNGNASGEFIADVPSQSLGTGPSFTATNYYDRFYYYVVSETIDVDDQGAKSIRTIVGPKIFFDGIDTPTTN